jgi:hypothetical protein
MGLAPKKPPQFAKSIHLSDISGSFSQFNFVAALVEFHLKPGKRIRENLAAWQQSKLLVLALSVSIFPRARLDT